MSVIRAMFDRVEQEHRTKLEQLQKMQEEQRYVKLKDIFVSDCLELFTLLELWHEFY